MKIHLQEKFGFYCLYREEGRSLYLLLRAAIKMKDTLEVNFNLIRTVSSDFLEESVGKLMKEFGKKQIYTYIKFMNLTENQERSIKFTIDFYYKYYHDEEYRYIIDAAFGKTINEELPSSGSKKVRKTGRQPLQNFQRVVI